jgi:uncharacterized protein YciI
VLLACAAAPATAESADPPVLTRYRLGLLYRGPVTGRTPRSDSLQAAHLANINRMFAGGVLAAAGPFGDDTPLRGIFVFTGDDDVALEPWLAADPLLAEQRLRLEMHGWMAPVGIGEDYRRRAAYQKDRGGQMQDSLVTFTMVLLRQGPHWTANLPPKAARTLAAQRRYTAKLRASGKLVLESAVEGTGDLRGLYLFDADTSATRRLVEDDPAVRAGRFRAELHPWWTGWGIIPGH